METPTKRQKRQEGDDEDDIDSSWLLCRAEELEILKCLRERAAESRPLFVSLFLCT
jgi:hypothetical protein